VFTYNRDKPLIRRMYRPVEYEARKAAGERTWSNEKWIPDPVRDRMIMRNLHVLKINVDGQRTYRETIKRVSPVYIHIYIYIYI
jgi:hypothetical protein